MLDMKKPGTGINPMKIEKLINRSVTFYLTSKSPSTNPSITVYSK